MANQKTNNNSEEQKRGNHEDEGHSKDVGGNKGDNRGGGDQDGNRGTGGQSSGTRSDVDLGPGKQPDAGKQAQRDNLAEAEKQSGGGNKGGSR